MTLHFPSLSSHTQSARNISSSSIRLLDGHFNLFFVLLPFVRGKVLGHRVLFIPGLLRMQHESHHAIFASLAHAASSTCGGGGPHGRWRRTRYAGFWIAGW